MFDDYDPIVGAMTPIVREYRCPCGLDVKMTETTRLVHEGNIYSSETEIKFDHSEPIELQCTYLMERYKEELRLDLERVMQRSVNHLREDMKIPE